ncbi:uncharacterized protein LOC124837040 [Vigna umbellata]|uniref:uncharacterized protein LOC124837040 n=1 Tax=Vigna umbellata TaxID=87088 RepID=UPI001F5F9EBD|nr:uncharacterized protein LOC124837040 [Vigna umbellata]
MMVGGRTVAGASSSVGSVPEWSLENFLQHHPVRFDGKCSPNEADHWFQDMERIYHAKRCPDENKLAYTEYLLTGEAGHWWSSMKMIMEGSETPITWELFKEKFYTEYFLDSVRYDKEIKFLQLVQRNMPVAEYADKFKHLLRFYTMTMDEEWQCRKFENDLRGDIKLLVKGLRIKELPTLVEMTHVMKKTKKKAEGQQSQSIRNREPSGSRSGFNSKRAHYPKPPSSFESKAPYYIY